MSSRECVVMRMTFVLVLGALRLAAVVAAVWAVQSARWLVSSIIHTISYAPVGERWMWFQSNNEGVSHTLDVLMYLGAAAALAVFSYRLASWIVPGAVGQCSRCGHPSGSPPGADGKVVCSECGATVVK